MNVVAICVDTLRWDHCGYNKRFPVRTPNIDRLAKRCTIFDRAIIGSFPTNPMRVDSFTGNVNFPRIGWQPLDEDAVVLGEVMGEAGYYTTLIYDHTPMGGITRGFDEVHQTFKARPDIPKPEDVPMPGPKENFREEGAERNMLMAEYAFDKRETDYWAPGCMLKAAEWLEDNAGRNEWLLWVDTWEPHEVWHTPQYYVDLYDANYEGIDYDAPNYGYTDVYSGAELMHLWAHYAAEVTLTDRWIGHLLDQMDVMGLWDNTMVVFISDHGTYIGEHGRTGKHTVASFSDVWPLYEEVTHIPLMVWLPGRKKLKKHVKALAQPADIMPTILDVCGVKGPAVYGKSWLPLMEGKKKRNWSAVFSQRHGGPNVRHDKYPSRLTVTTPKWTYIAGQRDWEPELYRIKKDPAQKRNLAQEHPKIVRKRQARVLEFMREQGAADEYVAEFDVL